MTKTNKTKKAISKTKDIATKSTIQSLQDRLNRSLADYANLEKRIENQRQLYATLAVTSLFDKLLTVLDDFFVVQNNIKNQGLDMALQKLSKFLASEGLEEIEAVGCQFDPATMDCVEVIRGKNNHVLAVRQKGYKLNGQIIRPVKVVVGQSNKKIQKS
ncbi:nucleotide exchange factor GrpE [Candidatus Shapirobacteria bacterium]|nr:MAG: nucleotide exchange factor GrpE [Candidatus Shapirobacteria bacterium]